MGSGESLRGAVVERGQVVVVRLATVCLAGVLRAVVVRPVARLAAGLRAVVLRPVVEVLRPAVVVVRFAVVLRATGFLAVVLRAVVLRACPLYTSPSPRARASSRMPSPA